MWYYYFPPSRRFGIEAMTLVANGVDFFFFRFYHILHHFCSFLESAL